MLTGGPSLTMVPLVALVVALGGCMSYALPPSPSAAEQELVASTHFPATVGVERYHDPVWSLGLLESLRYTGLFDRVAFLDAIKNPDLIARVREPVRAGEPLWVLPILTLGVIPAIAEDEWGEVFSLYSSKAPDRSVPIDFKYTGGQHVGWIAVVTGMVPGRTWARPPWTRPYRNALSATICRQAPEIRALLHDARSKN